MRVEKVKWNAMEGIKGAISPNAIDRDGQRCRALDTQCAAIRQRKVKLDIKMKSFDIICGECEKGCSMEE